MEIVKICNLTKRYGEKYALNSLNLEVKEGEITAILGESGAGKSTLLHAIAGLVSFEGEIDGVSGKRPRQRKNCAYLFQSPKLLPNLSVESNLKFVLPKTEWHKIGDILQKVGLKGREKDLPQTLSGGEKQRVAIARAFLFPHDTLLMDEPFTALDLSLKKSLCELVISLWQEKKSTVIFVTHDVREALLLATRALVLREGELTYDLPLPSPYPRDFFARFEEEERLVRALMREEKTVEKQE